VNARLKDYAEARELAVNLTLRELRGKYKRSVLGWTWSLLNPIASTVIYSVVFKFFLQIQPPKGDPSGLDNFALWLLCGLLAWNYFSNGLNGSMGALIGNANLIKKVYFPREVLVLSTVASMCWSLLIELAVLVAFLLLFGNMVIPWLPMVLVLVLIQTVFILGLGLFLAVCNVYFRDVQHLFSIVMIGWFYATPIVYPISIVQQHLTGDKHWMYTLYMLNPMTRLVEDYRDVMYDLRFPPLADIIYLVAVGVAAFVIGLLWFQRLEGRLAEEL